MNATTISMVSVSLSARAKELQQALARLRAKYHQANAKIELAPALDPKVVRERLVAHRQLTILVPMYRALAALAQQPAQPSRSAKARYLEQFSKAIAMVDRMVPWVDGSEEEYSELLNLRVPVDAKAMYGVSVPVAPLRDRMDAQRYQQEAEQVACETLVAQLVESFSTEQRTLLAQFHRLSRGAAMRLVPPAILAGAHA